MTATHLLYRSNSATEPIRPQELLRVLLPEGQRATKNEQLSDKFRRELADSALCTLMFGKISCGSLLGSLVNGQTIWDHFPLDNNIFLTGKIRQGKLALQYHRGEVSVDCSGAAARRTDMRLQHANEYHCSSSTSTPKLKR